ncbi:MAG: radical SAM protein [Candidatus Bathyarchaeia archaeon]
MEKTPIILTADEGLMSDFGGHLYNGYATCFPTNFFTKSLFKKMCQPIECYPDGRVKFAPLSLRIIEAILHHYGFDKNKYAIIHPTHLDRFINHKTKIVGISAMDPRGLGPIPTTFCSIMGGTPYSKILFNTLLKRVKALKKKYSFNVIVGGPGAWQLADNRILDAYGIDYLIIGEAEKIVPNLFSELIYDGIANSPRIIRGEAPEVEEILPVLQPTINGLVEVSRGCGRGCAWCSSATRVMRCIPIEIIKKSVEANVKGNMTNITLQSDDVLLYGAKTSKFVPDPDEALMLLGEIYSVKGVRSISLLHFTFGSIVSSPNLISKITDFLKKRGSTRFEVQIGIESGSPHIIEKYMPGKALPFTPEEWPKIVREAAQILRENKWFCYATLMIGFPDESAEDIAYTVKIIRELKGYPMAFIPLLFVPTINIIRRKYPCSKEFLRKFAPLFHEVLKHNEDLMFQQNSNSSFTSVLSLLNIVLRHTYHSLNHD